MDIDMKYEAIDSIGVFEILQRLEHSGMFVSGDIDFRKGFCRNDLLAINMCAGDCIQNVVGLVMSGGSQPEFAHRNVRILIVKHSVGHCYGCYALGTETASVIMSASLHRAEKAVCNEFGNSRSNIVQYPFGLIDASDRNSGDYRQPRNNIISPATTEFVPKYR